MAKETSTEPKVSQKNRILAYFADYFLILLILAIGMIPVSFLAFLIPELGDPEAPTGLLQIYVDIFFILFTLGYFILLEVLTSTTAGKKLNYLVVVDEAGSRAAATAGEESRITLKQAIIRNLLKVRPELAFIDLLAGYLVKPTKKQRFSEIIAGTMVIGSASDNKYTEEEKSVLNVFRIVLAICGMFFFILNILGLIVNVMGLTDWFNELADSL